MREFGIPFSKGLTRGLRAFPTPVVGAEELVVCFNLATTEHQLRGIVPIQSIGFAVPFVEYFAILDQADNIWYWLAGADLSTVFTDVLPDPVADGFLAVDVTPEILPHWLQVDAIDDPETQLYIYPAEVSGDQLVDTAPPPLGTGLDILDGIVLRSLGGWKHKMSATTNLDVFWRQMGV